MEKRVIHVAHSPDSDDAFMFYPLVAEKIDTKGLKFEHVLKDIESLNRDARGGQMGGIRNLFPRFPLRGG